MERPKRRITSRCLEYNGGLLHEEELALRRALQASLMASKTQSQLDKTKKNSTKGKQGNVNSKDDKSFKRDEKTSKKSHAKSTDMKHNTGNVKRKSEGSNDLEEPKRQKKLLVGGVPKTSRKLTGKKELSKEEKKQKSKSHKDKKKGNDKDKKRIKKKKKRNLSDNQEADDQKKTNESATRLVHAQRKFAQTYPSSPRSLSLYRSQMQPLKTRAKTEDFLDFLCLRGTGRLPKSLELFNSPCAPISPLTDEDEPSKNSSSTPSKISTNEQNSRSSEGSGDETLAKRSLNLVNSEEPRPRSSSRSSSTVSPSVSTRVQPHPVLPQFTNAKTNYGVLTHVPTPIPFPRPGCMPPTPPRSQSLDAYGLLRTGSTLPPTSTYHPHVSSIALEMHRPPSYRPGEKQGFHPVNQYLPMSSDFNLRLSSGNILPNPKLNNHSASSSPKKTCQTSNKSPKGQNKPQKSPKKSPKKGSTRTSCVNEGASGVPEKSTPLVIPVVDVGKQSNSRASVDQVVDEVPLFTPTEQEFKNPMRYIEWITSRAGPFGICVVVPPESWKPENCLSDEVRFTTKLQYIHRLNSRSPPVELEVAAIGKHLEHQGISLSPMPQIAGCELDLPYMSKVVREFGGLQQIIDKRKWGKVADTLKIPKTAVDRTSKLEQIYCKYLLSFDLLSEQEKEKLFESVKDEQNSLSDSPSKPGQEFMSKGRSMSLSVFQRTSKNVMEHHLKLNANVKDVEKAYWRITDEGQRYVVVHTAQLCNTAFPTAKGIPFSKSKWNLNILPKVIGSAVRDLNEIEGISSPFVKVEMLMSTCTWQTTPHALLTAEYLHQGPDKIWYSTPSYNSLNGETDIKDTMMSPSSIMKAGFPVYKVVQKPGQFIIKFPGAYHSSIASGYSVSEAVSFAPWSHIHHIKASFQPIPAQPKADHQFSWENLVVSSVTEELRRNSIENVLNILIPELEELRSCEASLRNELLECGVDEKTKMDDLQDKESGGKSRRRFDSDKTVKCDECHRRCFLSMVANQSNKVLCLQHAINKLKQEKNRQGNVTLVVRFDMSELDELLKEARAKSKELQRRQKIVKRKADVSSPRPKKTPKVS